MIVTSQISMYVLLGAVVFVAPNLSDTLGGASIAKTTTALLFVVGACFGLVQSIPILLNANAAADRIARLEAALQATVSAAEPREITVAQALRADRDARTSYSATPTVLRHRVQDRADRLHLASRASSSSSPAATARANRRSCGCWPGSIRRIPAKSCSTGCASTTIRATTIAALMSAIFFDYHLFQRLYGIPDPDPAEIDRLLRQFRLDGQDRARPTASFARSICPAASAAVSR